MQNPKRSIIALPTREPPLSSTVLEMDPKLTPTSPHTLFGHNVSQSRGSESQSRVFNRPPHRNLTVLSLKLQIILCLSPLRKVCPVIDSYNQQGKIKHILKHMEVISPNSSLPSLTAAHSLAWVDRKSSAEVILSDAQLDFEAARGPGMAII